MPGAFQKIICQRTHKIQDTYQPWSANGKLYHFLFIIENEGKINNSVKIKLRYQIIKLLMSNMLLKYEDTQPQYLILLKISYWTIKLHQVNSINISIVFLPLCFYLLICSSMLGYRCVQNAAIAVVLMRNELLSSYTKTHKQGR